MPEKLVPEDWRPAGARYQRLKTVALVGGGLAIMASVPMLLLSVWNLFAGTALTPRLWGMAGVTRRVLARSATV